MSDKPAEKRAKLLVGVCYPVVHGLALGWSYGWNAGGTLGRFFQWIGGLDRPDAAALALPLVSILFFVLLHWADKKNKNVRGLGSRSEGAARSWDYADSAIARQSIHAAIGIGVSAALMTLPGLWPDNPSQPVSGRTVLAWFALLGLAISTLLALISVLCYAVSKHWKDEPPVKRDLLVKASRLDKSSWYSLMTGLVWALAVADPAVSIWANLAYGAGLYYYYFQWWKDPQERAA
jgi:hypothetical protein